MNILILRVRVRFLSIGEFIPYTPHSRHRIGHCLKTRKENCECCAVMNTTYIYGYLTTFYRQTTLSTTM
jgi:hypothetical protein